GVIKQELGWRWALYSGGWSMFLGYSVAVGFYQIATFNRHPETAILWLLSLSLAMLSLYLLLRTVGKKYRRTTP
ncbi:MAG: hypothetical protein GXO35_05095, partial [Gammaproteobacteria bacterium]|nr:hypothetical protein [Gammaproteobacteria bacterium]